MAEGSNGTESEILLKIWPSISEGRQFECLSSTGMNTPVSFEVCACLCPLLTSTNSSLMCDLVILGKEILIVQKEKTRQESEKKTCTMI